MAAIVHIDVEDEIGLRRHLANMVERTEAEVEDSGELAPNCFGSRLVVDKDGELIHGFIPVLPVGSLNETF
jgi:hypothetical protein